MAQFVIAPPSAASTTSTRRIRLVVDSRDRNRDLYPTPSEYEVRFDEDIEDVVVAELVRTHVPLSALLVDSTSNVLTVVVGGATRIDVVVPPGDYTPVGLANALEAALNAGALPGSVVTYSAQLDSYKIECASQPVFAVDASAPRRGFDGVTTLDYPQNSIAQTLGFPMGFHSSTVSGELVAPCRRNFDLNRYAVLFIDGFNVVRAMNSVTNNSFAVLGPGQDLGADEDRPLKRFEPPVPKLARLRIMWKDYRGNRYDFQNQDHRLELVLTVLKHGQSS
jgi:hypothetical protein